MNQTILSGKDAYQKVRDILRDAGSRKFLLVCDAAYPYLHMEDFFGSIGIPCVHFSDFTPNPLYEDVCSGVALFNGRCCDAIVAIGGGSAIDVAKCIKLYCKMDPAQNYLSQEYSDSGVPLIALPTTAGTGSESTRYAVIYYEGQKQSVTHDSILPNYAILEPGFLKTLPVYQKKCTVLDALCQGIESWWSVNATEESMAYSKNAVAAIMRQMDAYICDNSDEAAQQIMLGANCAGRAINITQTTAAHAMSYKLTSMYGLPHGHAVAVCLPEVWAYMCENTDRCTDSRGSEHLKRVFDGIAEAMGCAGAPEAIGKFRDLLRALDMRYPKAADREAELQLLTASVNPVRLKNNPVTLTAPVLMGMYERIVG